MLTWGRSNKEVKRLGKKPPLKTIILPPTFHIHLDMKCKLLSSVWPPTILTSQFVSMFLCNSNRRHGKGTEFFLNTSTALNFSKKEGGRKLQKPDLFASFKKISVAPT